MAPVATSTFNWGVRTYVMAIVNATPDSFSGDGIDANTEAAIRYALSATADGADIIDVGGESTRPGHEPVGADEEIRRVVPVIAAIATAVAVPISVDTSKARVAEAAFAAGATIVNDVRGLRADPDLLAFVAERALPVVIMHDIPPETEMDIVASIAGELEYRTERAIAAGVAPDRIVIDPGFGFGKDWRQNLELLRRLGELKRLGYPLLAGFSRKSTVGKVLGLPVEERLEGTLATTALAIAGGADVVRVHDVRPNVRVARMADAVIRGPRIEP